MGSRAPFVQLNSQSPTVPRHMRFPHTIRVMAALTLGFVLLLGFGLSAAAQNGSSTSRSSSSSSSLTKASPSTATPATSSGSSFANSGTMAGSGGGARLPATGGTLTYLPAAPEQNGPGSLNYCNARSSCSAIANNCSNDCRNNSVVNGVGAGNMQPFSGAASSTNFASSNCTSSCQNSYAACSAQVSRNCQLSR
jgi:hypothetical protein